MHQDLAISKELSKTEGTAILEISLKKGKIDHVHIRVSENKRFIKEAVEGKSVFELPSIVSRICGTCSSAHLICGLEAIEKALGITPSEQTITLRKLLMYGSILRDHALHLYFFSLPDYLGIESILDAKNKKILKQAFEVKKAGNLLASLVGGRAVHAPFPVVGGFVKYPEKEDIKNVVNQLKKSREEIFPLLDLLKEKVFERDPNFVCLKTPDFSFLEGVLVSSEGLLAEEKDFSKYLSEVVIPYSQSESYLWNGKEYMVGALARFNLNKDNLNKKTKEDCKEYLRNFPSKNIFDNNLAQAIEMLHCIDASIEILETQEFLRELPKKPEKLSGTGVGVIEAPRGTLYYQVNIVSGKVAWLDLVIPTSQNLIKMENDIHFYLENLDPSSFKKEKILKTSEEIIRAYDPCFSCASHFLKLKIRKI
ncbi:MAG: nickel-dependent hydrogenase large subunit [archaeon]